jgi:murein DD-endopeptidase MepM/ murein hydrolase activator NlpD
MKKTVIKRIKPAAAGALACLVLALSAPVPVSASEYADLSTDVQVQSYQDQLAALQEKQAQATQELLDLKESQGNAWAEKLKLDELINITTAQKQLAEKQIDSINKQIAEKEEAIRETSARIESQQDAFYERMVDSYTETETDYLELILGARNLVDFLTKFDYVVNVLEGDKKIISKLQSDKEMLASDQAILEDALEKQISLVQDYEKAISERQLLNNDLSNYINSLQEQTDLLYSIQSENSKQQRETQNDLEQRILQLQIEQQKKKEEERQRILEEEERQRLEEEARRQREAEEWARQQKEAEEQRKREEEEWLRQQQEAEEQKKRAEEEWLRQQQEAAEREAAEQEAGYYEEPQGESWSGDDEYEWIEDGSSWIIDTGAGEYTEEYDPYRDDTGWEDQNTQDSGSSGNYGWDGQKPSSGYTGDTTSTWDTGWSIDVGSGSGTDDSWSKVDYTDSYKTYYVDDAYVGGTPSWVLEPGVSYTVSSEQGWRDLYGESDYHLGTDLACAAGTEIRAYNGGTVLISEYHSSYGNYVLVDHGGGIQTLYAHMSERAVSAGDWVESGQVLGYVGMTGSAYGYHLHFEFRVNGETKNPRDYMDF